ncbi:hypothetical protein [Luteolibacter soli]|uniref:Core-binding (CB) domain-containing protein n=1 Tax=Luteolibacter soli TaxID=3135280 RepID=A0ABU9B2U0_9BACT
MDTSGKALLEHWTWAASKGLMNSATAASLKSASAKVIGILDDWETSDVRKIDTEDLILRFQNLHARDFTPSSLETYASRFRKAVQLFNDYVSNPAGWRVSGRPKKAKAKEEIRKNGGTSGTDLPQSSPPGNGVDDKPLHGETHLISYPFPLRRGLTVKLSLPEDLTSIEAKRLGAFLMTLSSEFIVEGD